MDSGARRRDPGPDPGIASDPLFSGLVPSRDSIYQTLVPAYAVLFVFSSLVIMAGSIVAERQSGTLRRMRMLGVPLPSLLVGKALPYLALLIAQSLLLFLASVVMFGMSLGSRPWLILPVILCTSAAATALGLLVAAFFRSASQVHTLVSLVLISMAAISGCIIPRDWMPDGVQKLSLFVAPHSWSLLAYDQIFSYEQPDLAYLAFCLSVLIGFGGFSCLLAVWRFRSLERTETGR